MTKNAHEITLLNNKPLSLKINSKRNLNKIADELTSTKPNSRNGIKLAILVILILWVIAIGYALNKKLRRYLDTDRSSTLTQTRRGRFEMMTGRGFKKFKDEECKDTFDTVNFSYEK